MHVIFLDELHSFFRAILHPEQGGSCWRITRVLLTFLYGLVSGRPLSPLNGRTDVDVPSMVQVGGRYVWARRKPTFPITIPQGSGAEGTRPGSPGKTMDRRVCLLRPRG